MTCSNSKILRRDRMCSLRKSVERGRQYCVGIAFFARLRLKPTFLNFIIEMLALKKLLHEMAKSSRNLRNSMKAYLHLQCALIEMQKIKWLTVRQKSWHLQNHRNVHHNFLIQEIGFFFFSILLLFYNTTWLYLVDSVRSAAICFICYSRRISINLQISIKMSL